MRTLTLRIRRVDPQDGRSAAWAEYRVPLQDKMTVLDAVAWVQRHEQFDLAYRFACRVGMCGTCAMVVNGRESWACRTMIENLRAEVVTLEPLRHLPIVKDLVVDMEPFFGKMKTAMGHFVAPDARRDDWAARPALPAERPRIDPHIECISCGACYSACTVIDWDPEYLGPAALNRAATLVMDSRDAARPARFAVVTGEHGCFSCHSQFTCTEVCPMELRPTESIGYLKRQAFAQLLTPAPSAGDEPVPVGEPASIAPPPRRPVASRVARALVGPAALAAWCALAVGGLYAMRVNANTPPPTTFVVPTKNVSLETMAGALVFEEQGCEGCHSVLGAGGHVGRDLWTAGRRHDREWLRQLLADPDRVLPPGSMPSFALEPRETDALVEYLHGLDFAYTSPERIDRALARGGGELFRSGCVTCHAGDAAQGTAPTFAGEGSRRSLEWLTTTLEDPAFHRGLTDVSRLSQTRRSEMARYLSTER